MVTGARTSWTNWGGTYSCSPTRIESPSTEEEIAELVRASVVRGEHVKVIGSGHSFTDIGCTDGCLIKLDSYNKVLEVDRDAGTITAQAGITILELSDARRLPDHLRRHLHGDARHRREVPKHLEPGRGAFAGHSQG